MTKLVTKKFKKHVIEQIIESIDETPNTAYYAFAAEHVPREVSTLPDLYDMNQVVETDLYRKMEFGKRITSNDIKPLIKKYEWESGTRYTMYDHTDEDMFDREFYVMVDETAWLHVYKCLDNNGNTPSTEQPDFSHISGANTTLYELSDGYRWKYMYSFSNSQDEQFSTAQYIPVVANTNVAAQATVGTIDVVKVIDGGKNYNNYTSGTFVSGDIQVDSNDTIYRISNSSLKTTNGYYTGCLIYISSGAAVGSYRDITDYYTNATGSYITINAAFSTVPTNGDEYQINPKVNIIGNGTQTTNATVRALINSTSTNSVYRTEVLNRGAGYEYHYVANVSANAVVGVTSSANLLSIISPHLGHGYDAGAELGASHFCVGINFSNSESNTIPTSGSYQKVGIIRDPKFSNVYMEYNSSNGTFLVGETVHKITPIQVDTAATINTGSAGVTSNTGQYLTQFSPGDYVYLKAGNTTAHMLAQVNSITNATYMTISANGTFACTNTVIYIANVSATGTLNAIVNSTYMIFDDVTGIFETDDTFIGMTTGAKAVVNSISRNDVTKDFNTFIGMHKYIATSTSGTFSNNEFVFTGVDLATSTANARMQSANVDGVTITMYTTNNIGIFANAATIEGNTSGATATITNRYSPEIDFGSGEVLFIENITAVDRASNQTETLKLLFAL